MNHYKVECKYCGFSAKSTEKEVLSTPRCPRCKDRKIVVQRWEEEKIDYYQGCPPFPMDEVVLDLSYDKFVKLMEDGT